MQHASWLDCLSDVLSLDTWALTIS